MVNLLTEYVNPLIESIYAVMKNVSNEIKRDFGMAVSKKFYENFKHILFINRIIGLFPISVTKKSDCYLLQWSWLKVIIGNFFVLLYALLVLTGLIMSYHVEEVYNIRIEGLATLLVTLAEVLSLLFTWLIGQISVSILFQEFWKYLVQLSNADVIMGPIEATKKTMLTIVVVLAFTFSCLGMDIYMWANMVLSVMGWFSFIWKMVPFYFCYVFTMIMGINFWITTYGVTTRLKKLNELMWSYINLAAYPQPTKINNRSVDDFGKMKVSNSKRKAILQYKMPTSTMVKSFINVYGNISEANIALNNLFGLSMAIILVNNITCLVITPYVLYQQILNAKENKFIYTQSYWMLCHILRFLFLIEPCHGAKTQGIEIRRTVIKMLSLDLPEDAHEQIKILYMVVTENKIEFTATGLTFISRALFPTISSAVLTYLAILFQYKNNT